jgi:hypothetical protein
MQSKPPACLVIAKIWFGVVIVILAIITLTALVTPPVMR